MLLTEPEKTELRAIKCSETYRNDNMMISATRHNPYIVNGKVDCDRVIEFLSDYNEFLKHPMKPAKHFIERNMKL
jgi:hypothetical protein